MLRKYLLSYKTATACKSSKAIRNTTNFEDSLNVGVLFTYSDPTNFQMVNRMIEKLEAGGKKVESMTYIVKMGENESYDFSFFNKKDMDFWANWKKDEVQKFITQPFDYLLNLDLNTNTATQNILALSQAKCRVGRYEEGKNEYFELMIDYKENEYEAFIDQVFHYIKNMRNG